MRQSSAFRRAKEYNWEEYFFEVNPIKGMIRGALLILIITTIVYLLMVLTITLAGIIPVPVWMTLGGIIGAAIIVWAVKP